MATVSTEITLGFFPAWTTKLFAVQDTSTYGGTDLTWVSGDSRGLLKVVDPQGNTIYNNTDTSSPDIATGGGSSSTINLPTDSDGNIIGGNYQITLTLFDNDNKSATSFDASTIAANAISVAFNTFNTGQSIVYNDGGGTAVGGLSSGSIYYISTNSTPTSIKLSSSYANAIAGTDIAITAGVGTQTLTATQFERTYTSKLDFSAPTPVITTSWSVINPVFS